MRIKQLFQSECIRKLSVGTLSMVLLFFGFYANSWNLVDQQGFLDFQHDTESLVIGRMVESRQDGIFSDGGLTGAGIHKNLHVDWISVEEIKAQYSAYLNGLTFNEYSPYMSQIGGQAMIFSVLDGVLPFSPQAKLNLFYILTSLLSALALTLIILWFYDEFGLFVTIFVTGSMVLSPWLTVFGRNLWWSTWAFYLPMITVMEFLRRNRVPAKHYFIKFGILVLIAVLVKCFINGYEFITTTLIMMFTPFVYYGILDRLTRRQLLKGLLVAVLASCLAIFLSFTILSFQIGSLKGETMLNGVQHIVDSFLKRSYGDASAFPVEYAASLEASTMDVVLKYLRGTYINLNNLIHTSNPYVAKYVLEIRYLYLIVFFLAMSIIGLLRRTGNIAAKCRQKYMALIAATWFSILAPLSWYVIFKAHSFIHTHINNILWQMPFVFFGFAVCGLVIKDLWPDPVGTKARAEP
jgi:hypothetical protein